MCQNKLVAEGLSPSKVAEVLSTITGALVVTNALADTAEYDRATRNLLRPRAVAPVDRHGPRESGTKRFAKVAGVIDEAVSRRGTTISVHQWAETNTARVVVLPQNRS